MAQVIPKLNLNKTPALAQSNSLIFAKNIRLDVDGTIHRDFGVFPMSIHKGNNINNLVNYTNILNRIISDITYDINQFEDIPEYYSIIQDKLICISGKSNTTFKDGKYEIVGTISNSNEFFIFIYGIYKRIINNKEEDRAISAIIRYDEKDDRFYPCNCNWNWSGGDIDGCVINNLIGEKILNICEYKTTTLVPLKAINLNVSNINDDESIYTQIPNIPLTNLNYISSFSYVIPNGVYQFFVRYEIRKDYYTDWFPASNEIFVGNKNNTVTSFGTLSYTNTHRDSDNSFILSVEHLVSNNVNNYKSYQLGFILSHDDATYARAWKHFDFSVTTINFDYKATDAIELEVSDFLKSTYGLYNVENIATFKNKLYISNYTETDYNDVSLKDIAAKIDISFHEQEGGDTYDGNDVMYAPVGADQVISGLIIDGIDNPFAGEGGLFYKILNSTRGTTTPSIYNAVTKALENSTNGAETIGSSSQLNSIQIDANIESLSIARGKVNKKYRPSQDGTVKYNFTYKNFDIEDITVDGVSSNKESALASMYDIPRFLNENCQWIDATGKINNKLTIKIIRRVYIKQSTTIKNSGGSGGSTGGGGLPVKPPITTDPDDSLGDNIGRPDIGTIYPIGGGNSVGAGSVIGGGSTTVFKEFEDTYEQVIELIYEAWQNKYSSSNGSILVNNTTLIPYQNYKFYIHFVKSTGEVTNGYYCSKAGELEVFYKQKCNSVIYPIFKGIEIPNGYVACFFSILHTKNTVAHVFNIKDGGYSGKKEASSIDVNMMLVPVNKQIHIKQGKVLKADKTYTEGAETFKGVYYYSSDSSLPRYFGADGVITFDADNFSDAGDAYIITDYSISENENIELIKCTPYLNKNNISVEEITNEDGTSSKVYYFDEYAKMNLLGYICSVTLLLRDICMKYYSDGSSIYYKDNDGDDTGAYNPTGTIYLNELSKYADNDVPNDKKLANFALKNSSNEYIYSNYNLNYVALSEEPKMTIATWYNRPANDTSSTTEKQENAARTIVLKLLSSQLMSDIYTLPSMYKSYVRKVYSTYKENEITRFENTIRSSTLYGDESNINMITFNANDYYNVPTNRGIIVNMLAVGDAILVHTQDSMFKFSGSNTIQSSDGEILTPESTPFDTGVSEVFGSDFGFAGLQYKSDHIVTENGYIFFDRDSRIVYLYSGQGQIVKISESIEKLFRHKDIDNIYFANDYYNNRFFMSIMFYKTYNAVENNEVVVRKQYFPVTLSFNISDQIKSFVSLHDFYYHYAFNTKTKCYFLTSDNKDICTIDKNHKGCYPKLDLYNDKTYPQRVQVVGLAAYIEDEEESVTKDYTINSYNSIIDIIVNDNFEVIKTLDAVNWCGTKIKSEFIEIDNDNLTTLMSAEDVNYEIPCKYIRIYSDSCMTPLNDCTSRSNDSSITSINSYKYPRYNQGVWTFNYFRNILNSKDHVTNYSGDNNSLIEGKYFVTRFVFDTDFKFETLSLNYKTKI